MSRKLIVFDLDDTLVDTSHIFWLARSRFLNIMEKLGFNAKHIERRFEEIDGDHISRFGYLPARYERSMVATLRQYASTIPELRRKSILKQVRAAGRMIVTRKPTLIRGAKALLSWAKKEGYRTVLLTRGVRDLQRTKINANGIAEYFDKVSVVPTKSKAEFRRVIDAMRIRPRDAWIIGDSIRSDINPGLELGCTCIRYIYKHHSYIWKQEHGIRAIGQHYAVNRLEEIPQLISVVSRYRVAPETA